jgi:hypothetical protein
MMCLVCLMVCLACLMVRLMVCLMVCVRTEGAAAGAKTAGDELCEKLARKEPGALAALSTWVGLNPQGFMASVHEFPASRLLDEAVPLAAACAREHGPRGLEDLFILVEALLRGGYATPEEYGGEKNRAARDAILSGDVVALLAEEAATSVVKAFETASRHNERCLAILAQYLCGEELSYDMELRLQSITSRLDVFQFCKWWEPFMQEITAEEGRLLLKHHASVCLAICSSPSFTTDVLIAKDMPQLLLNMPFSCFGLRTHEAATCKLLDRVVDECSRGSPWSRAAAIRAGMFQIAWRSLLGGNNVTLHMAHKLLAWCYPMTASSEADTLRRILKTETSALAWCKDFHKAFGWGGPRPQYSQISGPSTALTDAYQATKTLDAEERARFQRGGPLGRYVSLQGEERGWAKWVVDHEQ